MADSIILIGMPACGKSTLGVVAAKHLGYDFTDTDILIQKKHNATLPQLIGRFGVGGFLDIEGEVISGISPTHPSVIATGGSAVHRAYAMEHLCSLGTVIYLRAEPDILKERISSPEARGIAMEKGMTFEELYALRAPLYEKYADITVDEQNDSQPALVSRILSLLDGRGANTFTGAD